MKIEVKIDNAMWHTCERWFTDFADALFYALQELEHNEEASEILIKIEEHSDIQSAMDSLEWGDE